MVNFEQKKQIAIFLECMTNYETCHIQSEFTLLYLGDKKVRQNIRKGVWKKKFGFNVCITSYSIATRDQRILRLRPWSYLVLDEAHQIKVS